MDNSHLLPYLLIWVGAIAALAVGRSWRRVPGTGLVLAYVLNLWLIHWIAPALYILPWHRGFDPTVVEAGLRQSMYGVVSFALASLVLTPFLWSFRRFPRARRMPDRKL